MKTKIIIVVVVLVMIAATAVKLQSNKRTVESNIYRPDTGKKVLVEADTVTARAFGKEYTYTGTFTPNREAMIIPQVSGQVRGLYFEEGDIVSQGKQLVQIDDDLLQAQRIAAEANLQNAQRTLERYENASLSGGISGMQVDNARLSVKNTDSQLRQINKQIALCRISAPFAGTITLQDVEMGSVVGSMPIGRITDLSLLKLEIAVPEKEVGLFVTGESLVIETDVYPGQTFTGSIEYISARADEAHQYLVRIAVRNTASLLKAGMYGTISLRRELHEETLAIRRKALLGSVKMPQVFVIENGIATLRDITTGENNQDFIQVVEGLQQGDIVVTSGHINLLSGSSVHIIQ